LALAGALALAVAPGFATAASAADPATVMLSSGQVVPAEPTLRTPDQETAFREDLGRLVALGVSESEISSRLNVVFSTPPTGSAAKAVEPAHIAGNLKPSGKGGSTSTDGVMSPMGRSVVLPGSDPRNMTVSAPSLAHSVSSQGEIWYAIAKWTWVTYPSSNGVGCNVNVGGRDGFGVSMNRDVQNVGESLLTCNRLGKCDTTLGSLSDNSARGTSYTFQDNIEGGQAVGWGNTDTGTLTFSFRPLSSGCIQAFSKYGHTWSSTAVTGVGVGPWSISISWSAIDNHWDLASAAGSFGC
jgi:hypothetical protein